MTKVETRPLNIAGESLQTVWRALLYELLNNFDHQPAPRGMGTREITGVVLRINDLRNNILFHPVRNINYKFMVAESLWIAFGRDDVATISQYNPQMARFSDDGAKLTGAYGPRLAPQWDYVAESIRKDSFSRQAVASIWRPNPGPSKDIPCTLIFQFVARDGQLNMLVTMRSSDIWLGLPYDVFSFSQLGNMMAGVLDLRPGYLQMHLGSSHIYDTNVEKAQEIIGDPAHYPGISSPTLPGWPPLWLNGVLMNPSVNRTEGYGWHPWSEYANVLQAPKWHEARLELINLNAE